MMRRCMDPARGDEVRANSSFWFEFELRQYPGSVVDLDAIVKERRSMFQQLEPIPEMDWRWTGDGLVMDWRWTGCGSGRHYCKGGGNRCHTALVDMLGT